VRLSPRWSAPEIASPVVLLDLSAVPSPHRPVPQAFDPQRDNYTHKARSS